MEPPDLGQRRLCRYRDDVEFHEVNEVMDLGASCDDAYTLVAGIGIVEGLTGDLEPAARNIFASSAWLITAGRR